MDDCEYTLLCQPVRTPSAPGIKGSLDCLLTVIDDIANQSMDFWWIKSSDISEFPLGI